MKVGKDEMTHFSAVKGTMLHTFGITRLVTFVFCAASIKFSSLVGALPIPNVLITVSIFFVSNNVTSESKSA